MLGAMLHRPTFHLNSALFIGFLILAAVLWQGMPARYPIHFGLSGEPDRWAEGAGMWVMIVVICAVSFGQTHLCQRFLVNDPDSALLNVPHKKLYLRLPTERKKVVMLRLNRFLGLVNTGVLLIFYCVLLLIYHTARNPDSPATAVTQSSFWIALALVLIVPVVETIGIRRMIRRKLEEEGLWPGPGGAAHAGY